MRLITWSLSTALISLTTSVPASAAWMVMVVGYATPTTIKKEFSTMESCEAAAEHILRVRTPKDPTTGVPGAWKYNYNIGRGSEPAISMLCVPSDEEMKAVQEGLTQKEWFRDLNE